MESANFAHPVNFSARSCMRAECSRRLPSEAARFVPNFLVLRSKLLAGTNLKQTIQTAKPELLSFRAEL